METWYCVKAKAIQRTIIHSKHLRTELSVSIYMSQPRQSRNPGQQKDKPSVHMRAPTPNLSDTNSPTPQPYPSSHLPRCLASNPLHVSQNNPRSIDSRANTPKPGQQSGQNRAARLAQITPNMGRLRQSTNDTRTVAPKDAMACHAKV